MKSDGKELNDIVERFQDFLLGDGEIKVTMKTDSIVPNAATFTFRKEDHTLGGVIQSALRATPGIIFAAYKVPHPQFPNFELRVTTDGKMDPQEALVEACNHVIKDLESIGRRLSKDMELVRIVRQSKRDKGKEKRVAEERGDDDVWDDEDARYSGLF
ncbi:DNA-directed RNA polymerase II core subunit [Rhizina undulata]